MSCESTNSDTKCMTKITIEDFSKICRTCLSDKNLKSIFNLVIGNVTHVNGMVNATYLLEYSVQLQATQNDNLPINICESCLKGLYQIYEFKQKCYENEALLKRIVDESRPGDVEHDNIAVTVKVEDCDVIIKDDEICDVTIKDDEICDVTIKDNDDCDIEDYSNQVDHDKESEHCEEIEEKADVQETSGPGEDHKENQGLHYGTVEQKCSKAAGPPYIWTTCPDPVKYETVEELRKYRRKSRGQTHVCEICHKTFNLHALLKRHMRIHTQKERRYECNVCLKKFRLKSNLKRHELIHTGEHPYVCSVCGKGFSQSTSLTVHQKTCCGSSYKCQICGRIYKRLHSYNAHLDQHSSGKVFYSQNSLSFHLKLHTGEKPYTCTKCNKSFSLLSTLNKHALAHKPHSCSLCSKRFTSSTQLKRHVRTHNIERPYVCDYCDAAFARKDNLKVHVRNHTGETPYVCSICNKGFYDSSTMKRHKKKQCTGTENNEMDCDAKAGVETKTD